MIRAHFQITSTIFRITREIEQVISTDEGSHAILLCADGGVVYYSAHSYQNCPQSAEGSDGDEARTEIVRSSASALLELPDLFRQKDVQQHTGSWALRRVGRQGLVVSDYQAYKIPPPCI